ncbi:hypothetical protein E8E12_002443 [Didymella heteroderae]|uniref:Uncharacterized protein n=1 Tax=Didymella heteroderae TaxID=1769908 RepID=A0A9P4WKV4_9PLEO|nr:hypothetical protein E8E12_002443 [Didymella heteroderae]
MCNKLLQTYACGHSRSVCTTPCTHALKPTANSTTSIALLTRQSPTVSSIVPVSRSPSSGFPHPQPNKHSPLRVVNISAPSSPTNVSALRFIPPATPSTISPVTAASPFLSNHSLASAPPSCFPSPPPSTAAADVSPEPNFCSYYIPRYLVTSRYPCLECYEKEEWKELRVRRMGNCRLGHPLDKVEEAEVLNGVAGVLRTTE